MCFGNLPLVLLLRHACDHQFIGISSNLIVICDGSYFAVESIYYKTIIIV